MSNFKHKPQNGEIGRGKTSEEKSTSSKKSIQQLQKKLDNRKHGNVIVSRNPEYYGDKRTSSANVSSIYREFDYDKQDESDDDDDEVDDLETIELDGEWDTSNWNLEKVNTSLTLLCEEFEKSNSNPRQKLCKKMIFRLLQLHPEAKTQVEIILDDLIPRTLKSTLRHIKPEILVKNIEIMALLAPSAPSKLSNLNGAGKISQFLTRGLNIATCLIQLKYRRHRFDHTWKQSKNISTDERLRFRSMYSMNLANLLGQWSDYRSFVCDVQMMYHIYQSDLEILYVLTQAEQTNFVKVDRMKLIQHGIIILLASFVKTKFPFHIIARKLYLNLIEEPDYIVIFLQSGVLDSIVSLLDEQHADKDMELILEMIEKTIYNIWFGDDVNQTNPYTFEKMESYPIDLNQLIINRKRLKESLMETFPFREFMDHFNKLLSHENIQYKMKTLQILHRLSCTYGYFYVLDFLLMNAGRYLSQLIKGLAHDSIPIVQLTLGLIQQLSSRPEGRGGMITVGIVEMLNVYCIGGLRVKGNSYRFTLGLLSFIYLCRQDIYPTVPLEEINLQESPPQTYNQIYITLMEMISRDHLMAVQAAKQFLRLGVLGHLVEFLVFEKAETGQITGQQRMQRCKSAIIASKLSSTWEVACCIYCVELIEHLAVVVQLNQVDQLENKLIHHCSNEISILMHSIKEGCIGLSNLAKCSLMCEKYSLVEGEIQMYNFYLSNEKGRSETIALKTIFHAHALQDILQLIHPLSHNSSQLEKDTIYAAIDVIGSICPYFSSKDKERMELGGIEYTLTLREIEKLIKRLMEESVVELLKVLSSQNVTLKLIEITCKTLSQLSEISTTCNILLDYGIVSKLNLLVPYANSIVLIQPPHSVSRQGTASSHASSSQLKQTPQSTVSSCGMESIVPITATVKEEILLELPYSVFRLIGQIVQTSRGRQELHDYGILPRVLKRFNLSRQDHFKMDEKCWTEICKIINAIVNRSSHDNINYNEMMIQYHVPAHLIRMYRQFPVYKIQTLCLKALSSLCKDVMSFVPIAIQIGVLTLFVDIIKHFEEYLDSQQEFFLRYALQSLLHISTYPNNFYHPQIMETNVQPSLSKIGNSFAIEMKSNYKNGISLGEIARDIISNLTQQDNSQTKISPSIIEKNDTLNTESIESSISRVEEFSSQSPDTVERGPKIIPWNSLPHVTLHKTNSSKHQKYVKKEEICNYNLDVIHVDASNNCELLSTRPPGNHFEKFFPTSNVTEVIKEKDEEDKEKLEKEVSNQNQSSFFQTKRSSNSEYRNDKKPSSSKQQPQTISKLYSFTRPPKIKKNTALGSELMLDPVFQTLKDTYGSSIKEKLNEKKTKSNRSRIKKTKPTEVQMYTHRMNVFGHEVLIKGTRKVDTTKSFQIDGNCGMSRIQTTTADKKRVEVSLISQEKDTSSF